MTTLPDPPRSALVDASTGLLTREWVLFFDALRRSIISGLDDSVGGRLDALEGDALFNGADGSGGSGSSFNDTVLRGRLDALELDLLFPASSSGDVDAAVQARLAGLEDAGADRDLEAAMLPDPAAALALLRARLVDLETEGAFP